MTNTRMMDDAPTIGINHLTVTPANYAADTDTDDSGRDD